MVRAHNELDDLQEPIAETKKVSDFMKGIKDTKLSVGKTVFDGDNHKLTDFKALSHSSSRWDFHFHSFVRTIYVRLYWLLELVVFYSLVHRGYIRKVSVQLVPKYFSRDCSTDSISCSERTKPGRNKY